jgi:hypothetical protein
MFSNSYFTKRRVAAACHRGNPVGLLQRRRMQGKQPIFTSSGFAEEIKLLRAPVGRHPQAATTT